MAAPVPPAARRLVVVTPFATHPPRRGGQLRTAGLLANLEPHWQVDSYSLAIQRTDLPWPHRDHRVTERWVDHRSFDPLYFAWLGFCGQIGEPPAYTSRVAALTPHRDLRRALARADAAWVAHPYPYEWVRRHAPAHVPMVLDAHNIETFLVDRESRGWRGRFAAEVERCERLAMGDAALVLSTSESEAAVAHEMGARNAVVVPSGVDVDRVVPVSASERMALRNRLRLPTTGSIAVFTGSAHPPNVEAVEYIERHASAYAAAGISVVVVGRSGVGRSPVPGVIAVGEVAHTDVVPYLQAADLAVCPLVSGSGTSLKSVEFLAAGLPLVSTPVGVRGLGLREDEAVVCDVDDMPAAAVSLVGDPARLARLAAAGRAAAETRFSWAAVGATASRAIDDLL